MTFTLYYTPTSCGAANFIVAAAGGKTFKSVVVDIPTHKTSSGEDYYSINPKGNVPAVVFDDGSILNENVGTLVFLADEMSPETGLAPPAGTSSRYQLLNALGWAASELHKGTAPLWAALSNPDYPASVADMAREDLKTKVKRDLLDGFLDGGKKKFVLGDKLSVADVYIHRILSWAGYIGFTEAADQASEYIKNVEADPVFQKGAEALAAAEKK